VHRCQPELLDEQAEILLASRFAVAMFSGPKVILKWVQGGPIKETGERPEAEAVLALTFRMYRKGDEISFREMAQLYEEPSVPPDLRDVYRELRDGNNRFLDEELAYTLNGEPIVQRELLEVFLWGGLAHVNPSRRKAYEVWRVDPIFFTLLSVRFDFVLSQVCNYVRAVRDLNVRLLEAGAD
jgi:hypothetical protein